MISRFVPLLVVLLLAGAGTSYAQKIPASAADTTTMRADELRAMRRAKAESLKPFAPPGG